MQKITPFLWFAGNAEEAMNFYISVFKNSKLGKVTRYGECAPVPKGTFLAASFQLEGQEFVVLNGEAPIPFTPAISFVVNCESQAEVDEFWEKLSTGGEQQQCGWLKDKFGVSWQIVPTILIELINDPDPAIAQRAMAAMMQMQKIDIEQLELACASQ